MLMLMQMLLVMFCPCLFSCLFLCCVCLFCCAHFFYAYAYAIVCVMDLSSKLLRGINSGQTGFLSLHQQSKMSVETFVKEINKLYDECGKNCGSKDLFQSEFKKREDLVTCFKDQHRLAIITSLSVFKEAYFHLSPSIILT